MCSKGSGRNIIPFFYAQEPDLRAVTPTHNVWLSPSDAVGPGLNLFGRANHYSTGRSPATGNYQEKNKLNNIWWNEIIVLPLWRTKTKRYVKFKRSRS
jgi:hypothetical protein